MRALALFLCATMSCQAWSSSGHRLVAAIAYDRLQPSVKAHVDAFLTQHPVYVSLTKGAKDDPKAKAPDAFLAAAVWPDVTKGDPRFWNKARTDSKPTPELPGFPDMMQHRSWHYKDLPSSPEGPPFAQQAPPNAEGEAMRILSTLRENAKNNPMPGAYDIPWLIQ